MGSACVVIVVGFYASPLATLYQVIREKNSIYFYFPLTITCLINGLLWFVYGLMIKDYFISTPNGIGAILAAVQLVTIWIYPRYPVDVEEA